ncbi:sphinganine kinase LCB3 [Sugiyamaella lignohabitans]|uniref:Sphinganine kinase LCB3 n=1 Tax=Sugiyamaella lignohabitans TaxID=796027 RepID=A0A161HHR8_9ASCO|nr:sphinganine kinase LCB3 [Sugiyamaella lignohabitans]ANB11777.1 sphinganine kinase LCB3 [Sugiyamaella lignohabitans]
MSSEQTKVDVKSDLSRSNSFIALLKAAEKEPCAEKDAGNKSEDHYATRLPLWRFKLRNAMLPIIRWETPHLARLQSTLRHPLIDIYFALSANLGTHTFYVIMLPVSYWYGGTSTARDLTFILAMGVYLTGFLKDLLCLPRPLSPPLHRITMSGSAALEYGFPSTHTANAVGVFLLLSTKLQGPVYQLLNAIFVFSIVAGRIYCGMHGFADVVIGALIGAGLWALTLFSGFMTALRTSSSYYPLLIVPLTLFLVRVHPEPVDDCPCFDDGVAFLGVLMGEIVGQWILTRVIPGSNGCIYYDPQMSGIVGTALRFVIGVGLVVTWRHNMKRILHEVLPPAFRFIEKIGLAMPRKYFISASEYSDIPSSIPDTTLFETHEITSIFSRAGRARSDSVGPQSTADLYESMAQQNLQHRPQGVSSALPSNSVRENSQQPDLLSTVVVPRVRYDVEVVTKLVVYCGIAVISVCVCGLIFPILGI